MSIICTNKKILCYTTLVRSNSDYGMAYTTSSAISWKHVDITSRSLGDSDSRLLKCLTIWTTIWDELPPVHDLLWCPFVSYVTSFQHPSCYILGYYYLKKWSITHIYWITWVVVSPGNTRRTRWGSRVVHEPEPSKHLSVIKHKQYYKLGQSLSTPSTSLMVARYPSMAEWVQLLSTPQNVTHWDHLSHTSYPIAQ